MTITATPPDSPLSQTTERSGLPPLSVLRPMDVLQVGSHRFTERAGGLERYFDGLLARLDDVQVRTQGLVAGSGDSGTSDTRPMVLTFASAEASYAARWRAAGQAARRLHAAGPFALLAGHFAPYTLPVRHALPRVPLVVHFHGPWAAEGRAEGGGRLAAAVRHMFETRVYRRAARVVTLSEAFAKVAVESYRVEPSRVRVIPGGVNVARFAEVPGRVVARERLGWPIDRPIVLAVRRLARRMGLERLLDAITHLRRHLDDVWCVIAGRGPLQDVLRQRIVELGLSSHVKLAGFVPDDLLPCAYAAADVSVVPSERWEGFGLSAVESLASGTPPVVTPVGGLPEVVSGLSSRLIAASSASGAVADTLLDVLRHANDGVDPPLSPAGCRRHARSFDWSAVVPEVRRTYDEAVTEGSVA